MPARMDKSRSASEDVAVLVPAAGAGRRLGGRRKQLRLLGGAPVVVQTLRTFDRCAAVDHLVVAGPPAHGEGLRDTLEAASLRKLYAVVEGGASRQASVRHALEAVPESAEVILVHDAVRPFIAADRIRTVVAATRKQGAAALAIPVRDTLRRGKSSYFTETVDRRGCFQMQTPQGFRRAWLEEACARASSRTAPATDDVALVQANGHDVRIVEGDHRNFKITTPADWQMAQALWPAWTEHRRAEGAVE